MKHMFGFFILAAALTLHACGDDTDDNTPATDGIVDTNADNTGDATDDTGEATDDTGEVTDDSGEATDDTAAGEATTHVVTSTDDFGDPGYMDFSPEDLTIAVGDTVRFEMSQTHNAVEVSEENYNNRIATALEGGFNIGFGETGEVTFTEAGVHFYVCQPHISADMIGTITVE